MFKRFATATASRLWKPREAESLFANKVSKPALPRMAITPTADTPRRDVANEGEHPLVVVHDIIGRSRPKARIIAVANEKGGVGKSTLAFHTAIALCDAGYRVAVLDLDPRQQSLARTLAFREATAKRLAVSLPSPSYTVFRHNSGAMLCQELVRIGWQADYILLDVAGSDSPLARRAIALGDTLLTPINSSFVDLDLLGRFNPTTHELLGPAFFARMVNELREEKIRRGMSGTDWVVVPNRLRTTPSTNQQRFDAALAHLAPVAGFRVGRGMTERVAYRELFLLGLTHLDLPRVPQLADISSAAPQEIANLLEDLAVLPVEQRMAIPA